MEEDLLLYIIINELCDDEMQHTSKKRIIWAKEWYQNRAKFSHSGLMKELRISAPDDFKNFLRMDGKTYDELLNKVRPYIEKQDTVMRKAITTNERLSATLRFLASGQSFEDLKFLTAISPQSLGTIIIETCHIINEVLKEYIQVPKTNAEWVNVSDEFERKWNFPNCIGAIDGKHVEIIKPADTGSYYFNYKKKFSIVLFALVDANYEFLVAEAGANGRTSDGGVLSNSLFYEKFKNNKLNIPEYGNLPNDFPEPMPFVLVGDDAFPLKRNLMKPYRETKLSNEQIIFNYRLSRARRIVENAFGILASRFRILLNTINLSPEKAARITLTTCYLHNFLRRKNPSIYLRGSVDLENINTSEIQLAPWRTESQQLCGLESTIARNSTAAAKETRRKFTTYFNGVGTVPWQIRYIDNNA
ncbi:protein ALP1-like [Coccinella septempunctata]|uniref:protein ALP1-like n=1 Tax=Coccinella septempunctata TaxID=41139 RepID=UPI001D05FD0A|nr:protein ALP1-like [Coccinella septempunctata]